MKKAFIIQAVGAPGSDTRERADRVFESIIVPACKATGYEAVRANDLHTKTIVEPIISALNTHPLAIADLGAPPWNPNVLMEVGFRLATGRPIVFLADTDPKPEIVPLHLRNARIHTINSLNPTDESVNNLIESIRKYGFEVNYWESDYPTIEFSISHRSEDGGRFIFANDLAAKLYGLNEATDLIGVPVKDVDPTLRDFIPQEHYKEYETDQYAILGKITRRSPGPKTARVPLWFTTHKYADQNNRIYWPVLVQYRYDSPTEEADIVIRLIFVDISDWDPMAPPPRQPPQVLHLPNLFRQVQLPPTPQPFTHDVFLSYNSKDLGYVSELYSMLVRCGLNVWFDLNNFGGATGLAGQLIEASDRSRIFIAVLGRNGLGRWQEEEELAVQLLKIVRGQKPFVLLLLPEVKPDDCDWRTYLPRNKPYFETVFEDRLRVSLPPVKEFCEFMELNRAPTFAERLLRLILQILRSLKVQ